MFFFFMFWGQTVVTARNGTNKLKIDSSEEAATRAEEYGS